MEIKEKTTEQLVQPFNAFEFKIWGLQAEVEDLKNQRKKRADFEGEVIEAQLEEFEERWLEEIQELSSIPVTRLETGHAFRLWDNKTGFLSMQTNYGRIMFQYMMKDYKFNYNANDEFEDLDIHDFAIYYESIDRDGYQRMGILWAELESLVPRLVFWNREAQSLLMDINVKILTVNLELKMLDDEMARLREEIKQVRFELLKAGHSLDLGRRFYITNRKFEYVQTINVTNVSKTGKTCTIHIDYWVKEWWRCYYGPSKKRQKTTIRRVRMYRLLDGLFEP